MYTYSILSQQRLETIHPLLQQVFSSVLYYKDHTIIDGFRSITKQLDLYDKGYSQVKKGNHNYKPSLAVDSAPYPQNYPLWKTDTRELYHFSGIVLAIAWEKLRIKLRWGGDWNMNGDFTDENFHDLFHFELLEEDVKAYQNRQTVAATG